MTFTNIDFVDLLNFYKNQENFPANARKSFDKFSEVSKSDDDEFKEVRIIVKSLGYSYSKPYPINIETDPQKVEIFKKNSHNSI